MSRKLRPQDDEKRMRRVPSEDKTSLDKYKHIVYNEDIYESEEFLDALDKKVKYNANINQYNAQGEIYVV